MSSIKLTSEDKKKSFADVSQRRLNTVIDTLISMRNLTNKQYYEYSDEDVDNIIKLIREETDSLEMCLRDHTRSAFRLGGDSLE